MTENEKAASFIGWQPDQRCKLLAIVDLLNGESEETVIQRYAFSKRALAAFRRVHTIERIKLTDAIQNEDDTPIAFEVADTLAWLTVSGKVSMTKDSDGKMLFAAARE